MSRAVRLIAVFALLGAAVSYAVAWTLHVCPFTDEERAHLAGKALVVGGHWEVSTLRGFSSDEVSSTWSQPDRFRSSSVSNPADCLPWWSSLRRPPTPATPGAPASEWEVAVGFPCRCAHCWAPGEIVIPAGVLGGDFEGFFSGPGDWRGTFLVPDEWAWARPSIGLPFLPIWPGLLANTAFYGVIVWVLWFTPGAVRREMRRRRGSCVGCAYDLRGAEVIAGAGAACPECERERQAVRGADPPG
jgi:hypothetical protein